MKTLKILLASILVVGTNIISYAQFIPKAGVVLASTASESNAVDIGLGGTYSFDETMKIGFSMGAAYGFSLGNLTIQPEFLFIQKGSTLESNLSYSADGIFSSQTEKKSITINYLEMPVIFRYSFGPDPLKFFVSAGPSFAVGLGGKVNADVELAYDFGNGLTTETDSYKATIKFGEAPPEPPQEEFYIENRTDFGFQIGGGLLIANRIMVDLRYGLGFSKWSDNEDSSLIFNTKNRALQLTVGFVLGF